MTEQTMSHDGKSTTTAVVAISIVATCIKLLLIPAYHSTDFEVHRNWLAITHSLPTKDWYFENTSEWTLDYPPFFAWFEWFLSKGAEYFDPNMLVVDNLNYKSTATIIYQRLTVIVCDSVLLAGVLAFSNTWPSVTTSELGWSSGKVVVVTGLVLFNPGLLMVDHIHFQYNGFLLGILLLSVAFLRRGDDKGDLLGGFFFAVLLLFKHIFAYAVPLYFVYLLRHYCWQPVQGSSSPPSHSLRSLRQDLPGSQPRGSPTGDKVDHGSRVLHDLGNKECSSPEDTQANYQGSGKGSKKSSAKQNKSTLRQTEPKGRKRYQAPTIVRRASTHEIIHLQRIFSFKRLVTLAVLVSIVALVAIVPITVTHEDPKAAFTQFISRLAPVQRGLCHAYWAPNIWALYNMVDKAIYLVFKFFDLEIVHRLAVDQRMTGGVVGVTFHTVLPTITPGMTLLFTLLFMLPALYQVWRKPHPRVFLPALVYCILCSFMLGYHVHEKAILMALVPLTMSCCDSAMDARLFLLMSWTGNASLFPLLFTPDVAIIKPLIVFLYALGSYILLDVFHIEARKARRIRFEPNGGGVWLWAGDKAYLLGLICVYIFGEIVHPGLIVFKPLLPKAAAFAEKYQFLPLMCMSVYCALGLVHTWGLSFKQLKRKVTAIDTYQPSPRKGPSPVSELRMNAKSFSRFDLNT